MDDHMDKIIANNLYEQIMNFKTNLNDHNVYTVESQERNNTEQSAEQCEMQND